MYSLFTKIENDVTAEQFKISNYKRIKILNYIFDFIINKYSDI